jgi:hypothetical protein
VKPLGVSSKTFFARNRNFLALDNNSACIVWRRIACKVAARLLGGVATLTPKVAAPPMIERSLHWRGHLGTLHGAFI